MKLSSCISLQTIWEDLGTLGRRQYFGMADMTKSDGVDQYFDFIADRQICQ